MYPMKISSMKRKSQKHQKKLPRSHLSHKKYHDSAHKVEVVSAKALPILIHQTSNDQVELQEEDDNHIFYDIF